MKKIVSKIFAILFSVCTLFFTFSCGQSQENEEPVKDGEAYQWISYEWTPKYTEQEHISRISAFTEEIFAEELESGELDSYKVELLYDFYGAPRFYLVDFVYRNEYTNKIHVSGTWYEYTTDCGHFIGEIRENDDDIYYNSNVEGGYKDGPNPYKYLGYENAKKYWVKDVFAIDTPNGLLQIYQRTDYINTAPVHVDVHYGHDFTQKLLTKEDRDSKMYLYSHYMRLYLSYGEAVEYRNPLKDTNYGEYYL